MQKPHKYSRPDLDAQDSEICKEAIRRDLARVLTHDSTILDVGANRGQFASEIISILPEVTIFSFEPVAEAFSDLKEMSFKHQQINPCNQAVSSRPGSATLYITESDVGSSLLKPLPDQPSKWLTLGETKEVETIRLDDFIREKKLCVSNKQIKLLKTDAQGADLDVIQSAGDFLAPESIENILVEVNFQEFYHNQQGFHEILGELDKRGYRLAWLYPHRSYDEWL
jgi:FkbM family methyltransferase